MYFQHVELRAAGFGRGWIAFIILQEQELSFTMSPNPGQIFRGTKPRCAAGMSDFIEMWGENEARLCLIPALDRLCGPEPD